jgi:hypothetical protein
MVSAPFTNKEEFDLWDGSTIYLILAVIGFVGPYIFFISFLTANGLNGKAFVQAALRHADLYFLRRRFAALFFGLVLTRID